LAAASPELRRLLEEVSSAGEEEEVVLLLPDTPSWALKQIVEVLYGGLAVDTWDPGSSDLTATASLLGLLLPPAPPPPDSAATKDLLAEVDNISADLFKDILIDQEIPVDIFDFFEEKSCEQLNKLSSCIRKSVIQRLPRMVDKSGESKNGELKPGSPSNKPSENEREILNYSEITEQKRDFLLALLKCEECGEVCLTLDQRAAHARDTHGNNSKFCCNFHCMKTFESLSKLSDHFRVDHKFNASKILKKINSIPHKPAESTSCRICGQIFTSGSAMLNHFKTEHPTQQPFMCMTCGHTTGEEVRLRRHLACHRAERPREYCDICYKEFRNKVSLRTHRNMVHKMGKQYTCSYCGKLLYSSQYVKKHEATHKGEKFKGVACGYCGKTVEYTKLKNHELTHTGEKPFQCPDCDYRCIQRSNLRIHMRGVHKKELPR